VAAINQKYTPESLSHLEDRGRNGLPYGGNGVQLNQKRTTQLQIRQVNFVIKTKMTLMSGSSQVPLEAKLIGNVPYQPKRLFSFQLLMI
jgi:hypothetical protein